MVPLDQTLSLEARLHLSGVSHRHPTTIHRQGIQASVEVDVASELDATAVLVASVLDAAEPDKIDTSEDDATADAVPVAEAVAVALPPHGQCGGSHQHLRWYPRPSNPVAVAVPVANALLTALDANALLAVIVMVSLEGVNDEEPNEKEPSEEEPNEEEPSVLKVPVASLELTPTLVEVTGTVPVLKMLEG